MSDFDEDMELFGPFIDDLASPSASDYLTSSASDSDDGDSSSSHTPMSPEQGRHRKSKATKIMSEEAWEEAGAHSIELFKKLKPLQIDQKAFTIEQNTNRCSLKTKYLNRFQIFPWFSTPGVKFRQTLQPSDQTQQFATSTSRTTTATTSVADVIEAANFFLQNCGQESKELIIFLEIYYMSMEIPVLSQCFSTIVDMYEAYHHQNCGPGPATEIIAPSEPFIPTPIHDIVNAHDRQIHELEERMDRLEESLTADIPGAKRVRRGGDRACFYPIRRVDLATRDQWCVPGAVLGLYGDGVGRLLPLGAGYRRSIVVYSTDPDTEEEHPNPNHRELYVRVVMVGEAPVTLRFDQYDKLKAWCGLCDLYVNQFGDVCIRKFERDPPHGGTIFAQTSWSKEYAVDEKGYPVFQGTQGVCAKIFSPSPPVNENTRIARLFHKSKHAIKSLFIKPKAEVSLLELMAKRQELFVNLSKIKAKHRDYKACLEQCNQLRSEMANHGPSSSSPVDEEQGRNTTANLKELESRLRSLMDHETFEREKAPLQTELNRMKVLIKEYVKTHQHEFS